MKSLVYPNEVICSCILGPTLFQSPVGYIIFCDRVLVDIPKRIVSQYKLPRLLKNRAED